MKKYETMNAKPYPLGVTVLPDSVQFTFESASEKSGVILIDKKTGESYTVYFDKSCKVGNISSVRIKNLDINNFNYKFLSGEKIFADPYSNLVIGNENYGIKGEDYSLSSAFVYHDSFDWSGDVSLLTPADETIVYLLHVRGFTMHTSSKVRNKGTYEGIIQKINYLKELGITAVELMPSYEFEEYTPIDKRIAKISRETNTKINEKVNYWGYKEGFYFAPKASYSSSGNPVDEFKTMVKKLHKAGIEVYMQFYFPDSVKCPRMYEILRFWLVNYHIDGFHLKGNQIPVTYIATDPLFSKTKIFYDYIPENEIYEAATIPEYKNLFFYSDNYMYQMRKVLKGDEDTLKDLLYFTRNTPQKSGTVNFITNYYGFTLNDLVSYDRKHNEENGENNADGCDYNFSWNCGTEGKTKKVGVMNLRKRMMKNALLCLMLSKGTPLITAGDEICNTQFGNNNPYNQDNEICYINWNMNSLSKEILEYTKEVIRLRKSLFSTFIHKDLSMLDRDRTGYPDLSYHGDEAWKADLSNYNRHVGIMYSDYDKESKEISLLFTAYNFYWKNITFALPKIPSNCEWEIVTTSGNADKIDDGAINNQDEKFELENRSITVFKVKFNKIKK